MAGNGVVGLLGGNEMRDGCLPFDRALLRAAGRPGEVCMVPAALARSGSISAAMRLARRYFQGLGVRAVEVKLRRRSDASRPDVVDLLARSRLTYLLGGDPGHLLDSLIDTPAWQAINNALRAGGALAGSSAGAMVLCQVVLLRSRNPGPSHRHGRPGIGLLPDAILIPHLNRFAPGWLTAARRQAPGQDILGLDEETGVLNVGGRRGWSVHGPGRVSLWRRGGATGTERRDGETLPLRAPRP
jgi:cyanophycinase